jgi:predicted alpha-1,2-mannosidase
MNWNKLAFHIVYITVVFSSCSEERKSLVSFVDPFIGTSGHGHTFPGACLPFGMVQLSPDTGIEGWDWCSGYHTSDSSIMGFSHTHLSGTGAPDLGDVLIMPMTGAAHFFPGSKDGRQEGYRSRFSHETEVARPGYYSVKLDDYNIKVELTATSRAGFHRYTFPQSEKSAVIIDLVHGIGDTTLQSKVNIVDSVTITGYRRSNGMIMGHQVYFCAKFSKPFDSVSYLAIDTIGDPRQKLDSEGKIVLHYKTETNEQLLLKVGLSMVNEEGAMKNVDQEIREWNFDYYVQQAEKIWEDKLSKIEIESPDVEQKKTFYTALYHSLVCPNLISDVDGTYRGWDGKIHVDTTHTYYTNFSLWDTYRAFHPLHSLLYPEMNLSFINSMIQRYREAGHLPMLEYGTYETYIMIGFHSIPVIAEAILQNQEGIDYGLAFNAMKASAMNDYQGVGYLKERGYIPSDLDSNSVSKMLEYAYDDWCVAQVAKKLNKDDDYRYFMNRAKSYAKVFDSSTGLMRGRLADGSWRTPFNPKKTTPLGRGDFTEANSWQYSFYVPQDVNGLIALMGGDEAFALKLDSLFSVKEDGSNKVGDVTGLIGQYAQGNEPSHHIAYLYNFVGQPSKGQRYITEIKSSLYSAARDGLSGNDDCGQMSAWYVFSALGFYPVTPGINYYVIGSPSFSQAKLHLPNGNTFSISAPNASAVNYYIKSARLNKNQYAKTYITFEEILKGGTMEFELNSEPQEDWGTELSDRPRAEIPK